MISISVLAWRNLHVRNHTFVRFAGLLVSAADFHSASVHPGAWTGADELLAQHDKLLGSNLWWTNIPSTGIKGCRNTLSHFMLLKLGSSTKSYELFRLKRRNFSWNPTLDFCVLYTTCSFLCCSGDYSNALLHYEKGITKLPEVSKMAGLHFLFGVFPVKMDVHVVCLLQYSCYSNKAIADYERCYTSKTSWNVKVIPRNTDNNTGNGSSPCFSCFIVTQLNWFLS